VMWRHGATKQASGVERGEADHSWATEVDEPAGESPSPFDTEPRLVAAGGPDVHRADLQRALTAFRASYSSGVFSAKRTVDPLLDLWALASSIDRAVARPIEVVLRALVERSVVSSTELLSCADRVEEGLARLG